MGFTKYTYEQLGLDTGLDMLTNAEKKTLEKSWATAFAADIFPYLDEDLFAPLFTGGRTGRRNVPVNVLAGALLLKELRQMSDEELADAAAFDLRMQIALHITNRVGKPFGLRTVQSFRMRLKRHLEAGGENLLQACYGRIGGRVADFIIQYGKKTPYYELASAYGKNGGRLPDHTEGAAIAGRQSAVSTSASKRRGFDASGALAQALAEGALRRSSFSMDMVSAPEIFKENCLPAHSDHVVFASEEELAAGSEEFFGSAGSSSLRCSLNGLWKFSYAARPADAPEGFEAPSFDCRSWADIRVPAHIQMEGYDVPAYINYQYPWDGREDLVPGEIPDRFNPTASYVKYFSVPEGMQTYLDEGSPLLISFQGVESGFALWCNGHYVGYSEDSFTPSEFDLTPYLCAGENKLAVRVFKWTASSWLESQDFYRFSGIFRDVFLYTVPQAHLYDLRIRPLVDQDLTGGTLQVDVEVWIRRDGEDRAAGPLSLRYELAGEGTCALSGSISFAAAESGPEGAVFSDASSSADPSVLADRRKRVGIGTYVKRSLQIRERVENPRLWSAEDPQLYALTLRLVREREPSPAEEIPAGLKTPADQVAEEAMADRKAVQTGASGQEPLLLEIVRERVGFRRFEMQDGLMCLNGKRIVFRGVNRHEFTCDSGRVVPDAVTRQDLVVMKQNNINAVRTCHYPNSSALYRLCDELGLYMIAENNMESHASWAPCEAGLPTPGIVPGDDGRWEALLMDRVNSCYQRDKNHPAVLIWSVGNESFGGTVIRDMADRFRRLDPDRLVHYEGIFHDRTWPSTSDMESQMYPSAEAIEAFLQDHRDKPFICCEYTHAMGNSCGGMHRYTDLTRREPLYQGGFIWDFVDQSLRGKDRYGREFQAYGGDCGERPTDYDFSGNGILDGTRRPYAGKMQEVKYNYQDIRLEVLPAGPEGKEPSVRIFNDSLFTNTDHCECLVLLEKNGRKLAQERMETSVPPQEEAVYPLPEKICGLLAGADASLKNRYEKGEKREEKTAAAGFPDEYCVTVSMRLKEDCAWAPAGHEVAFGQGVFPASGPSMPEAASRGASGPSMPEAASKAALPGAASGTDLPEEASGLALPGEASGPSTPEEASRAALPGAASGTALPEEVSGAALPEEASGTSPSEISGTQWRRSMEIATPYGKMVLTRGSLNAGIRSPRYTALFSVLQGGLVSYCHGGSPVAGRSGSSGAGTSIGVNTSAAGQELLKKIPRPCFWRAPTSNDEGNHMAAKHGAWRLADACQIPCPETLRIFTDTDHVCMQIRHELPIPGNPTVMVGYRFYADGMLTMTLDWEPLPGTSLPSMPVFGFLLRLDADFDRFTYYGKGPAENYCDRSRGARLGIFESTVKENLTPYLVPQECGNRTGVRWAKVTDRRGRGMCFLAGDPHRPGRRATMEFSALPYTPGELENASHPYELPPVHYTNVRCALMQMGVGGDDSWGAEPMPQYCLPADRPLHFELTICGI